MHTLTNTRQVWIGSLHAYNSGRLIGRWYDASENPTAEEWTAEHAPGESPIAHEELWCFDLEGFPKGTGEMSPDSAAALDALIDSADDPEAFAVFLSAYGCEYSDTADALADFPDRYMGQAESETDYVAEFLDDCGMFRDWPEDAVRYFNLDAYTRDLFTELSLVDGYVFQ